MIRRRLDAAWLDVAAGVAVGAGGVVEVAGRETAGPASAAMVLVLAALVCVRRRARIATGYAFVAWMVVTSGLVVPAEELLVSIVGLLLFPYTVGSCVRGRLSSVYLAALFAAIAVVNLTEGPATASDWIFPTALGIAAFAAGRNAAHRSALAVELHEAALRATEERDAEARRAVAAERRRIAHEMHDVVAHSISMMVVQAAGARRMLERDPGRAEQAAAEIERTGRGTLLEMRRLLGVMRDRERSARLTPNPTLDALDALVARAREAGVPVRLRTEGRRRPLGAGLELAAYRVVQEALEDVMRVAPGAETEVLVRHGPASLEITVADARPYVPFADGAGPSLVGVRERVALYGGELRTGQRPGGGHEVHVRFPLDDPPGTTPTATNSVPAQGAA